MKLGEKIPEFLGVNQDGKEIFAKDFLGKKLVIFFFPKANTAGCSAEACELSDNYERFVAQGYQILGISADELAKQKKFHDKYAFPYDLISDETKEICEQFGVWKLKKMMGKEFMGIVRTTFIFDENGICIDIIDKVKTKEHSAQILK